MRRGPAVFALLAVSLSACSLLPEPRPVEGYDMAVMQPLRQQNRWMFEGRLVVTDRKESISVSVIWRHDLNRDDIELFGPLAQGRVKIELTSGQVTVDDGDSRKLFHGSHDAIVAEQLGVNIPVNSLRFWVLGLSDLGLAHVEQPSGFFQGGWLVRYREMQKVKTRLLPKRLVAEKDNTRIKLIVDQWDLK